VQYTLSAPERDARIANLQAWMREQSAEFGVDHFPAEVQAAWDQNTKELADLYQDRDENERKIDGLRDGVKSGRYQTESGDRGNGLGRPGRTADKPLIRLSDGRRATVERNGSFQDHPIVADYVRQNRIQENAVINHHGSFGNLIRAMTTTSGSAVVPTVWASDIIDRARNASRVIQAGAQVVPMDAHDVKIGRLTTDPTAAFRNEGSTITASDPVFDNVTLSAKTLSALVIGSMEWFQDSPNVDAVVSEAIAKAIATELDLVALFGGQITGAEVGATGLNRTLPNPPNPSGVLNNLLANAASSVLGGQTNGTSQTALSFWNEIIDVAAQPSLFNEQANAIIWAPQTAKHYAKTYDTAGQPLGRPPYLDQFGLFATAQIPALMTQGTMTTQATDVFAGDWSQLIIGQRLGFTVQTLTERYAELGQIGIVAHWRGDIGITRPRAFSVFRFLDNA
jgi:HK97 family phage major capsid protein